MYSRPCSSSAGGQSWRKTRDRSVHNRRRETVAARPDLPLTLSASADGKKLTLAGTCESPPTRLFVENELGIVLTILPDLKARCGSDLRRRQRTVDITLENLVGLAKRDIHHPAVR